MTITGIRHGGADARLVFVEASEPALLAAEVLKYQREIHRLSLAAVAKKLGAASVNAYAAYERGKLVLPALVLEHLGCEYHRRRARERGVVPWDVNRIDELVEAARMRGVRPWLAIKERLAECAIEVMAVERRTVLQGGAALHFAYHSPRLSADVDFVGSTAHAALSERGEELAAHASAVVGAPARWSMRIEGRLARGKVTIELDAARRIVLPIEAFDVPAHEPNDDPRLGLVEQAGEIAADKTSIAPGDIISAAADWLGRYRDVL